MKEMRFIPLITNNLYIAIKDWQDLDDPKDLELCHKLHHFCGYFVYSAALPQWFRNLCVQMYAMAVIPHVI